VSHGGVAPFDGDLDDYQRYLLDEAKRVREGLKAPARDAAKAAPRGRRSAAGAQLKPLKQALDRLEARMAALQAEKAALEARLAGALAPKEMTAASDRLHGVNEELARDEEKWLELCGEIEAIDA
jgi:ATP-binding cassette subfamily F protein 3